MGSVCGYLTRGGLTVSCDNYIIFSLIMIIKIVVTCPKCGESFLLELSCVFEKNNLLAIFDSSAKAEGYSKALRNRKTKIKTRILNKPTELVIAQANSTTTTTTTEEDPDE